MAFFMLLATCCAAGDAGLKPATKTRQQPPIVQSVASALAAENEVQQQAEDLHLTLTGGQHISLPANPVFRRQLADKLLLLVHATAFRSSVYASRMQQPSFGWHHPQLQQLLFPDHFFH